jgi:hypothetical protein
MAKTTAVRRAEEKPMSLPHEPAPPVSAASGLAALRRELEAALRRDASLALRYPALTALVAAEG